MFNAQTDHAHLPATREHLGGGPLAVRAADLVLAAMSTSGSDTAQTCSLECARILKQIEADDATIAAALISGSLPRGSLDVKAIAANFGDEVLELVTGAYRAGRLESLQGRAQSSNPAAQVEMLRKMLLALADDVRVVLIKLAERVVLMRSATRAAETERVAAGQLTRDVFAPLANWLGVFPIKWELEDLSFRFLEPEVYKRIAGFLDGRRSEREAYIEAVISELRGALSLQRIEAQIAGRPKHIWSIHRKMQSKNLPFEKLYDVRAVRVLVHRIEDCYAVLGLVHDRWAPIPGEFDDYIARPKANDYQSLHTAVIGPQGKTLEVQIRTFEMHRASEHGVAAHWRYKEFAAHGGARSAADRRHEAKIAWIRQVLEWKRELVEDGSFSEQVKQGLFNDTIYVLTPQDKVVDLCAGATPIDFAYNVHTDLGHRCRGAKVNGQIVPLNTRLQNADRVEILAAKQGGPSRDWLNPQSGFLASSRALAKVRAWFRQEYFEVDLAHGRQILDRELARSGASTLALERVAAALDQKNVDECLAAIGRGEITPHQLESRIRDLQGGAVAPADPAPDVHVVRSRADGRTSSGGMVLGVNNIATLVAKCCKPVPPDAIVGFVTKARGVTVHRADCVNVTTLDPVQRERLMQAEWGQTGDQVFVADIEIAANDRQGLLRDISEALAHERINVTAVNSMTRSQVASLRFTLEIARSEQLERALRAVRGVPGVEAARRR